jgi:cell division septation protein DedD
MSRPEPRPDRPPIEVRIRDLDKIREQTPWRVEPRHVRGLVILALVLVGTAFGGGFLLGSGVLQQHASPGFPDAPVVDPAPRPAAAAVEGADGAPVPPLPRAVAGSVTPVPAPPPPEPEPVPEPVPEPAPEPAPEPPPPPEVDPRAPEDAPNASMRRPIAPHVQAVGLPVPWPLLRVSDPCARCSRLEPEDECAAEPPAPPEPAAMPAATAPVATPAATDPVAAPAPTPAPKPATAPVPTPAAAPGPTPATTPAPKPAATREAPDRAAAPTQKPSRQWQVQVRAYQDETAARAFQESLVSMGYRARIVIHDDAQGKRWFRIRIGRYNQLAEAQAFARRFNERHNEQSVAVEVAP